MKKILSTLGFCLFTILATAQSNESKSGNYDIRDFGAVGDDQTINTKAIQDAIDTCTSNGGGTVLVPNGKFRTGTIQLKDNVTIHFSPSGEIVGSTNRADYLNRNQMIERGVGPGNGNIVLLFAANAKNIAIEGHGTIDGDGGGFYTGRGDGSGPKTDPRATQVSPTNAPNVDRPHLMVFNHCERLTIRDVYLTRSAYHCVRILQCKNVLFDGITIYNRVNFNNDG
ncbi:MAG TPA: glycosyl hydrolase family 28 protein, partial [Candidatus Baltobacteraceae bacterium]|nr:glycosyl hydrolase family 28 protein [Candidatus Baltobacteraceae bacterium]